MSVKTTITATMSVFLLFVVPVNPGNESDDNADASK